MDVLTVIAALCGAVVQDKLSSGDNKVFPDPDPDSTGRYSLIWFYMVHNIFAFPLSKR